MMRTGEQRRDQRLLWLGVGVAVVVVGLFAFLTGLYSNRSATPSPAYYAPIFPIGFPWVSGIFSLFFLFWAVSWFFRPWGWGGATSEGTGGGGTTEHLRYSERGTPRER